MSILYITSDRPGAGKTALAGALATELSRAGKVVGYLKPFSDSPQSDPDVAFMGLSLSSADGDGSIATPRPTPDAWDDLPDDVLGELNASLDRASTGRDLVLVEGPSLTATGGDGSAALAGLMDARVLLLVDYRPETTAEAVLEGCRPFGERLQGVLINSVTRYRDRDVRRALGAAIEASGPKLLGALPEDRLMAAATVGQIAGHLDGRWVLGEEKSEDLVENYLIGGNIMDSGETYFGRMESKAVIVRGDRPDIQLAALSTPTTCLVLTGGHDPIQYVYHQAEEQEVPLLVVQNDTMSTAQALETMENGVTSRHPRKLERFQELLRKHADMETVRASL